MASMTTAPLRETDGKSPASPEPGRDLGERSPESVQDLVNLAGPGAFVERRPWATSFEQLAALPDECMDVANGAALIARDAYGTLDVERLLARLDDLAAPLASNT